MKDYKGRQLARLGAIIFILFLIAGIINACAIFYGSMYRFRIRQKNAVEYNMTDLNIGIDIFNHNYFWFLDFFQEHYSEMHINDKPLQDIMNDGLAVGEKYGYQIPTGLAPEDMERFTYEEQLLVADLAYTSGCNVYNLDLRQYGMEGKRSLSFWNRPLRIRELRMCRRYHLRSAITSRTRLNPPVNLSPG